MKERQLDYLFRSPLVSLWGVEAEADEGFNACVTTLCSLKLIGHPEALVISILFGPPSLSLSLSGFLLFVCFIYQREDLDELT